MTTSKMFLLTLVLSTISMTAFSGEKGGSGINGEESIILEDFQRAHMCPIEPSKKLCSKIFEKINSPMWSVEVKSMDDQNEEEFFFHCCRSSDSSSEPGKE